MSCSLIKVPSLIDPHPAAYGHEHSLDVCRDGEAVLMEVGIEFNGQATIMAGQRASSQARVNELRRGGEA